MDCHSKMTRSIGSIVVLVGFFFAVLPAIQATFSRSTAVCCNKLTFDLFQTFVVPIHSTQTAEQPVPWPATTSMIRHMRAPCNVSEVANAKRVSCWRTKNPSNASNRKIVRKSVAPMLYSTIALHPVPSAVTTLTIRRKCVPQFVWLDVHAKRDTFSRMKNPKTVWS